MTDTERVQVEQLYSDYNYKCFLCGERATQRSHIIGNTLLNKKLFGNRIISHPLNWLPACSLKHNALIDIGKNERLARWIVSIIDSMDDWSDKRELIESIVRENIQHKQSKV